MMTEREKEEIPIYPHISAQNERRLKQVDAVHVWASYQKKKGNNYIEINKRIQKANNVYCAMNKGFINKRNIKTNTNECVQSNIQTYSDAWVITQLQKSKLDK